MRLTLLLLIVSALLSVFFHLTTIWFSFLLLFPVSFNIFFQVRDLLTLFYTAFWHCNISISRFFYDFGFYDGIYFHLIRSYVSLYIYFPRLSQYIFQVRILHLFLYNFNTSLFWFLTSVNMKALGRSAFPFNKILHLFSLPTLIYFSERFTFFLHRFNISLFKFLSSENINALGKEYFSIY